jgi:hypothetical protein
MTTGRRRRDRVLGRTTLVVLVAGALSVPLFAAPRFFIARFQNHLSPHLQDADEAFVVEGGLIRRIDVAPNPAPCCQGTRHYLRTERSDYLTLDWTYEITFNAPANAPDELLFIGFGEAVPDPLFYEEPRNSVTFRIHQGLTGASDPGWWVNVVAHDVGYFSFTYDRDAGYIGGPSGGTYTARIRKVDTRVTFEILGTDIAVTIPDIIAAAPFLNQVPTRIFFGNALGNYSFSDMRVLPERRHGPKK